MFYGSAAVRSDFSSKTLPGLALYLLLYSLLGCIFALALRGRASGGWLLLAGIIVAMGWFYLSFHLIWKSMMPLAYLLSSDRPMTVGHLIFGVCIGRFPAHYLGRRAAERILPPARAASSEPESQPQPPIDGPPVEF
jgi:hypothetical protein